MGTTFLVEISFRFFVAIYGSRRAGEIEDHPSIEGELPHQITISQVPDDDLYHRTKIGSPVASRQHTNIRPESK
jgi:hypothetical protein